MQKTTFIKSIKNVTFILLLIACVFSASASIENKVYFIDSMVSHPEIITNDLNLTDNNNVYRFFSHGREGELLINGKWLNPDQIAIFLESKIGKDQDVIEIYGCEFAKGLKGLSAVFFIENKLGVSVSASTNITGRGGDWKLEVGENQDKVLNFDNYNDNLQCANKGTLPSQDFDCDGIINSIDVDDDNDGVLDTMEGAISTFGCNNVLPDYQYAIWEYKSFNGGSAQYNAINGTLTTGGKTVSLVLSATSGDLNGTDGPFQTGWCPPLKTPGSAESTSGNGIGLHTITFSEPILNPRLMVSSINTGMTFSQNVVIDGTSIGTSVAGCECAHTITYPGIYTSISWTGGGNEFRMSISVEADVIMPTGTATYVDPNPVLSGTTYLDIDDDQDGVANRFDLDSDDDGCSDAKEAGSTTSTTADYTFAGPYGTNGLANAVETIADSGIINYTSKYIIARSAFVNYCGRDSDGDGIDDSVDIDDDNDGVLDAIEAPSCYYSADEIGKISTVTSQMAASSFPTLTNWYDGVSGAISDFNPTATIGGLELFNITPIKSPIALSAVTFDMTSYSMLSTGSTAKLQGYNGTTWIDLSTAQTATVTYGPQVFTNTLQPTIAFQKFRLLGVSGTTGYNYCSEIHLIPLYTLYGSYVPKQFCNEDKDDDGITNDKDSDSDNDGCSDAKEAGATTSSVSNYVFSAPYGANGLANSLETVTDNGIINYSSTYSALALSSFLNLCADTDGDGVSDIVDIDDDNDGILDATEAPSCYYSLSEAGVISNVTSEIAGSDFPKAIDNKSATYSYFTYNTSVVNKEIYNMTPSHGPMTIDAVSFDLNHSILQAGGTAVLQGFDGTSWVNLSNTFTDPGTAGTTVINNTLHPSDIYQKFRIYGLSGIANYGYCKEMRLISGYKSYGSYKPKTTCTVDTDGDGKINTLDIDSDGDGCSDSKEAGATTSGTINFTFSGPFGANGFADSLETVAENGMPNYTSTYQYAIGSATNVCADTDGDGISDLVDIDDDNDGVLDAEEAPSCYYTADESKLITSVTSQLAPYSTYILANSYDNNATTSSGFIVSQNWVGQELFNITPTNPLPITGLELDLVNWAFSSSASDTFKLQGYNETTWTDLSLAVSSTATTGTFTISNTLQPNVSYKKYRLVGVAGTNYYSGVRELRLVPASSYQGSPYPKPTCLVDTDGDLLTNDKDPDSDGDNCSDAKESSATTSTTVNYAFVAPYGANGLADALETVVDNGITNYALTYQYALSNTLNACTDTDGDGIGDLVDIDDDNDGILDAVEAPSCYYTETEASTLSKVSTSLANDDGANLDLPFMHDGVITTVTASNNVITLNSATNGSTVYTVEYPAPIKLTSLTHYGTTFGTSATALVEGSNDGFLWTSLMSTATAATAATNTFTVNQNSGFYRFYRILKIAGTTTPAITTYELQGVTDVSSYAASLNPKATCAVDTDGDGVTNDKDLDSDGDNCSDAKEAGATTSTVANYVFSGPYGSNGYANALETVADNGISNYISTYSPNATSKVLNACTDTDGDGISDLVDIDDDNDGVLDAVEAPSCYYTSSEIAIPSSVSTQLTIGAGTMANLYDSVSATTQSFTAQDIVGKSIYEVTPASAVAITSLNLYNVTTIFVAANKVKLQGWTVASWIDLSVAATPPAVVAGVISFSNTINPTVAYPKYRLFGDATSTGNINTNVISEITLIPTAYQASKNPKATCTVDTDGDLLTNDKDPDSDGDNCSDAKESSATTSTTVNYAFVAPYGANGLADALETVVDNGITNYALTYQYALSNTLNACTDTDGDGIGDLVDIDDDNDGILDAVEAPSCYYTETEASTLSKVSTSLANDDGANLDLPFMHDGVITTVTASNNVITLNSATNGSTVYTVEYPAPIKLTSLTHYGTTFGTSATALVEGSNDGFLWTSLMSTATAATAATNTFTVNQNSGFYRFYRILKIAGTTTPAITTYELQGVTDVSSYAASLNPKATCAVDTDGDGVTNDKDLDSDGDNCSDAKEAGATTSTVANYVFSGPYGSNGYANALETVADNGISNYISTYSPNATSKVLNACTDTDGDGISDLVDIDDDNDGILDTVEDCDASTLTSNQLNAAAKFTSSPTVITGDMQIGGAYTATGMTFNSGSSVGAHNGVALIGPFIASGITTISLSVTIRKDWNVTSYPGTTKALIEILDVNQSVVSSVSWQDGTSLGDLDTNNLIIPLSGSVTSNYYIRIKDNGTIATSGWGDDWSVKELTIIKQNCNLDTDADGIPNRLDLDSDNDGCSDANEAGATTSNTTNYTFSGPYGANGLANSLETATESGIINYTLAYANTINSTIKNCVITCPTVTNTASNNINPTSCKGSNGSVKLCGVVPTTTGYIINYSKDGTAATPLTNQTADASGCVVISNLGAGVYSNIIITHPIYCTSGTTAIGPITLTVPVGPALPTLASTTQPTCAFPSGTIVFTTQSGVEYSVDNGVNYQTSAIFAGLSSGSYTLKVRSTSDTTCVTAGASTITINAMPSAPTLSAQSISTVCPSSTVDLNSLVSSSTPTNSTLEWFTNSAYTGVVYTSPTAAIEGTYYAFYHDTTNGCYTSSTTAITVTKTCCAGELPPTVGVILELNCAGSTNTGTLFDNTAAVGVTYTVPYTGGNGGNHNGQIVASTGVTGLTATLLAGDFANGAGSLTYTITGIPATSGTASFAINIGGKTCTLNRTVTFLNSISTLDCSGAVNTGLLTNGVAASTVSSSIPYTGGDGSSHSGQIVASTGVTGLTATLLPGTFATGSGSLTYTITGTPISVGTASFALNIGGKSCTLTRTVNPVGVITALNCAGALSTGSLTIATAASGVSSSVPYTGGNGGNYNGQIVASTGVTGLNATLVSGTFSTGSGSLTYTITGTPSSVGTASFALDIAEKTCSLIRVVDPSCNTCTPTTVATFTNYTTIAGITATNVGGSTITATAGSNGTGAIAPCTDTSGTVLWSGSGTFPGSNLGSNGKTRITFSTPFTGRIKLRVGAFDNFTAGNGPESVRVMNETSGTLAPVCVLSSCTVAPTVSGNVITAGLNDSSTPAGFQAGFIVSNCSSALVDFQGDAINNGSIYTIIIETCN
jgi:hypothetical protein